MSDNPEFDALMDASFSKDELDTAMKETQQAAYEMMKKDNLDELRREASVDIPINGEWIELDEADAMVLADIFASAFSWYQLRLTAERIGEIVTDATSAVAGDDIRTMPLAALDDLRNYLEGSAAFTDTAMTFSTKVQVTAILFEMGLIDRRTLENVGRGALNLFVEQTAHSELAIAMEGGDMQPSTPEGKMDRLIHHIMELQEENATKGIYYDEEDLQTAEGMNRVMDQIMEQLREDDEQ